MAKKQDYDSVPGIELKGPAEWNRSTIADGKWLEKNTLAPLYDNEIELADAIGATAEQLTLDIGAEHNFRVEEDEKLWDALSDSADVLSERVKVLEEKKTTPATVDIPIKQASGTEFYITNSDYDKILNGIKANEVVRLVSSSGSTAMYAFFIAASSGEYTFHRTQTNGIKTYLVSPSESENGHAVNIESYSYSSGPRFEEVTELPSSPTAGVHYII